jgi:plastocyanin
MKANPIIYIVLGILLLGGLFFVFKPKTQNTSVTTQQNTQAGSNNSQVVVDTKTIVMKADSFEPANLTIQKGTKVIFKNEDSTERWPASAMHPTHTRYPGSGIDKCGTAEEKNIFDACRGMAPGKEYSFTFNEVGDWSYHDHLNPSIFGKIIVVENSQQAQDSTKKTFNAVIKNNQLVSGGGTLPVTQGDEVTITITSDTPDSLHLHGYDKSVNLEKNKPASLTFTANLSGRFEYELEDSQLSLGALEVQPK